MKENQFVIDLGNVKLTEDQRKNMHAAIQRAVAGELANVNLKNNIVLIPVFKLPKGPIIDGIIIRDLGNRINDIINQGNIKDS